MALFKKPYLLAVAYITFVIILAHLLSPASYDWTHNTISDLAAQGYQHSWVMRAGFIGFGALVIFAGLIHWRREGKWKLRHVPVMLYGLAILFSGIFSTAPFRSGVTYSQTEASIHSICATVAGAALSLGILLFALTDQPVWRKLVHAAALVLVTLISLFFANSEQYAGAIQRLLYLTGFAWLVFLDFSQPTPPQHQEEL
jgi:hypothetical membrane protein